MEPCYQPTPPSVIQNRGKNSKQVKFVEASGVGYVAFKDSKTHDETKAQAECSISDKPEDSLDPSKLTVSQPESKTETKAHKNSSKQGKKKNEQISKCDKFKDQKVKKAKPVQKSQPDKTSKNKSAPITKTPVSDSNSLISKLIESRLGEISKEVSFLQNLSTIDQNKLQAESKSFGIGKMKKSEPNVANPQKTDGKGYVKQQWVLKSVEKSSSLSQAESGTPVSLAEPILGWVPKKN
jgi:hypothetical protein